VRRTVDRVAVEADTVPEPADYFADDDLRATAPLDEGWLALTDTELLRYHPDGEPPLARVDRPNLTGLAVQRTGGARLLAYVPRLAVFGAGALVVGLILRGFSLPVSTASGSEATAGLGSLLGVLQSALSALASGLLLGGVGLLVLTLVLVGVALSRRDTELAIERVTGGPATCPVGERVGKRALQAFESAPTGTDPEADGDARTAASAAGSGAQSSAETPAERSSSR
jgi:hypothetical protein